MTEKIRQLIRDVPDFPRQGILFKDITTVLADGPSYKRVIEQMAGRYQDMGIDRVVSVEARGFILGAPLAYCLGAGFIPVRKKGKLPFQTLQSSYELEYGVDTLEIHVDALVKGHRVLVVDDLLATGGTVGAVLGLVEKLGGQVIEAAFMIELEFLHGRKKLAPYPVFSLIKY
jgi:adenine phosphoribosyltransferase